MRSYPHALIALCLLMLLLLEVEHLPARLKGEPADTSSKEQVQKREDVTNSELGLELHASQWNQKLVSQARSAAQQICSGVTTSHVLGVGIPGTFCAAT